MSNEAEWSYDGSVYRMTALRPLEGAALLGKALGALPTGTFSGGHDVLAVLEGAFTSGAAPELFDRAATLFAAQTTLVGVGRLADSAFFDLHFAGRLDALAVLLARGVALNYGPLVARLQDPAQRAAWVEACGLALPSSTARR